MSFKINPKIYPVINKLISYATPVLKCSSPCFACSWSLLFFVCLPAPFLDFFASAQCLNVAFGVCRLANEAPRFPHSHLLALSNRHVRERDARKGSEDGGILFTKLTLASYWGDLLMMHSISTAKCLEIISNILKEKHPMTAARMIIALLRCQAVTQGDW